MWYKFAQEQNDFQELINFFLNKYPEIVLRINEYENKIKLDKIFIPKEMRGLGIGTEIITALKEYSQRVNKPIVLNPEPEKGKKGALQRFYRAAGDLATLAGSLDRVGQLCEGQRTGARIEFPIFGLDDRGEPPRQRGLSHGQEDRVGLREPARNQRTGSGAFHQTACLPQGVGGPTRCMTCMQGASRSRP
jgi:predicted GNAT family acetyltransferase